jgi:hypothetical protein
VWNSTAFDSDQNKLKIIFKRGSGKVYLTHNNMYLTENKVNQCLEQTTDCSNDHSRLAIVPAIPDDFGKVYDMSETGVIPTQNMDNLHSVKSVILI